MNLALGGHSDAPAIVWSGRTYTYAELAHIVDDWPRTAHHDAATLDVPDALACVFAAAAQGSSVRVVDPLLTVDADVPDGAFLLVATSGSSGNPQRLARSVESWTDSFPAFTRLTGLSAADRVLITGPLHATMHLFAAVHALSIGACVTDDPTTSTAAHAVPAVLRTLIDSAPALRIAVVAGIALDPTASMAASRRGITVIEYYGAAELSLVAARVVPEPLRAFPGVDLEIRDGCLWVRSPYVANGGEEWRSAGDLATLYDDGTIVVHGRADAAINVGGATIIAEDVERVLAAIDGVRGVAVVGTPHSVLGEIVTAVVELDPDTDLAAVRATARAALPHQGVPRKWLIERRLPRTASGKVARGQVRAALLRSTLGSDA
ncbi:AMP-binding enzyme [Antrihabitans cavernicola]|uniref:Long-chain fatty acid--CoA ligase n=1 Tax=Antrihabitans cavernicola TaxID=2495913 RepID=A0A5A7SCP0_9NOCA|nr:AMP-binding protein [Spelaeibacter cavernicola]KAA0023918.1 long-chain fatty acid--CoA ligase [Spelaeibacter cavernicola]